MKKKLLIMCDYFYPDVASTGQLLTELCQDLQHFYDITVLTSVPREKESDYPKLINYENNQNVRLARVKTKPFNKSNKVSRIKHIIEHCQLCRKAIRYLEKQDLVFAISQPPLLGGLLGLYAKKIHKAKLVYNIQDFNPEQAEAVGYFKIKPLLKILKKIDTRTCNKADKILIVGKDMKYTLSKRGINPSQKVSIINNWIDEEKVYPVYNEKVHEFKQKYGLDNKFVFMYSGNIGLYYDLENLIKVIAEFDDRENVVFAFVGDGAKKKELEKWVESKQLKNIRFIPFQRKEDIIYSLNAADVHLVTNQKGIKGVSVPSKIYGVMAAGKYILGILEEGSEAADLIKSSACGCIVEPRDYEGVRRAIEKILLSDYEHIKHQGLKGRKYLENNLRKSHSIQKYKDMFEAI